MGERLRLGVGWVAVLAHLGYAIAVISRWSDQDPWYRAFAVGALVGALLLAAYLLRPALGRRLLSPALIALTAGCIGQLDACAFFLIMRIPFDTHDLLQFALPPAALVAYILLGFLSTSRQRR